MNSNPTSDEIDEIAASLLERYPPRQAAAVVCMILGDIIKISGWDESTTDELMEAFQLDMRRYFEGKTAPKTAKRKKDDTNN